MAWPDFAKTPAVEHEDLYHIKSLVILQPSPVALTDGFAGFRYNRALGSPPLKQTTVGRAVAHL
jgi:hypothetical protein